MKKIIAFAGASALLSCLPGSLLAGEQGAGRRELADNLKPKVAYDKEDGLTYRLAGTEDEGAIRFFVIPDTSTNPNPDITASQLNAIAPAAGVQFRLEF